MEKETFKNGSIKMNAIVMNTIYERMMISHASTTIILLQYGNIFIQFSVDNILIVK